MSQFVPFSSKLIGLDSDLSRWNFCQHVLAPRSLPAYSCKFALLRENVEPIRKHQANSPTLQEQNVLYHLSVSSYKDPKLTAYMCDSNCRSYFVKVGNPQIWQKQICFHYVMLNSRWLSCSYFGIFNLLLSRKHKQEKRTEYRILLQRDQNM